jgi:hypothetical protein
MAGNASDDSSESVGELLDALAGTERRFALYYLRDRETATREELATVLAAWRQSRRDQHEIATPEDRKRLLASLHHRDLPKLRDAGLVRYDPESGEVALDATDDRFDAVVSETLAYERRATERDASERRDDEDSARPEARSETARDENSGTVRDEGETPDEREGDDR